MANLSMMELSAMPSNKRVEVVNAYVCNVLDTLAAGPHPKRCVIEFRRRLDHAYQVADELGIPIYRPAD